MKPILIVFTILISLILFGCQEKTLEPAVKDNQPPGAVKVLSVISLPGGLKIEYNLPADKDLLYVKAVYTLKNNKSSEVKASYYDNKLEVMGFGDTDEKTVTLYAVDRSENLSAPVEVKGIPEKAPVIRVEETMVITANFGGARFEWVNETEAPLSILLYAEDSLTGQLSNVHTIYTSQKNGAYNLRGYDPVPTRFAAVVRDRWDNYSDTVKPPAPYTLIPWEETYLDKTKMGLIVLQNDTPWDAWGFQTENAFDGNLLSTAHTQGDHPSPQIITIDLGVVVQLSRVKIYQRSPDYYPWFYTHGNPLKYDLYGALELPDLTGDLSQWTKLREECVSTKPSGNGPVTEEDIQHAIEGDEFDCDPIEIRYFRFAVKETWDGAGFINFNEISWWGSIKGKKKK